MCIFSREVDEVRGTRIFARGDGLKQFLVYSMTFAARQDLAMVLPIPTPQNSREDAVRFINLEDYTHFFDEMELAFPRPRGRSIAYAYLDGDLSLEVHDVGDYFASFVPTLADFGRLDKRYCLPGDVWDQLPMYQDFGFVVCQLKKKREPVNVHPMAFEFPRRDHDLLYFPTFHIHDAEIEPTALFDHVLYAQIPKNLEEYAEHWHRSHQLPKQCMNMSKTAGIVDGDATIFRYKLRGWYSNQDSSLGIDGLVPVEV